VGIAQVIVVAGTVVLMVGLTLFVRNTQLGKAMRATSFDREAAAMMGIDVDRVIVATFFIGSALAGAAGVFNGLAYQQVWPYMGFVAGLYAFIAAVVGGIGNLPGAVLGGLLIGLAQSFSIGYVSSAFSDAVVFGLLIAVMIVRPSGLLGRAAVTKV
jgi:branched-chain amino acid transport system permease protein